jgi:hypothetical protein
MRFNFKDSPNICQINAVSLQIYQTLVFVPLKLHCSFNVRVRSIIYFSAVRARFDIWLWHVQNRGHC